MSDILIQAENLCYTYEDKPRPALQDISFTLKRGEIVTLIGPNGAGKSTLLKLVLGLLSPQCGTLWRKPDLILGYMPQKLHLDPALPLTVRRFLELGLRPGQVLSDHWLKRIEIDRLLDQPLQGLSGGQFQRVLLARAVLRQPDLLVLDEPLQGVDVAGQRFLYQLLAEIRDALHCGILMVSHDLHLVMAQTDQVLCINQHICCQGTPQSVRHHPAYQQLFGTPEEVFAIYTHRHNPQRCATHEGCDHE